MSVLLRFTISDHLFGIFILFLKESVYENNLMKKKKIKSFQFVFCVAFVSIVHSLLSHRVSLTLTICTGLYLESHVFAGDIDTFPWSTIVCCCGKWNRSDVLIFLSRNVLKENYNVPEMQILYCLKLLDENYKTLNLVINDRINNKSFNFSNLSK